MRLNEAKKDLYRRMAKEQGYKSRAAFKLIEANQKYHFIRRGDKVVDFGSAPGGWLQVASELVGARGLVVGVDLHDPRVREANVVSLVSDVNAPDIQAKVLSRLGGFADVVLSDLSPSVSGVWELDQERQVDLTLKVVELCSGLLKPGGSVFCKLFESERSAQVRSLLRKRFTEVRAVKPAASRSASSELYYYCEKWLGETTA